MIYRMCGNNKSTANDEALYKFQMDHEDIAANMGWPWLKEYSKPFIVSVKLLTRAINVYKALFK